MRIDTADGVNFLLLSGDYTHTQVLSGPAGAFNHIKLIRQALKCVFAKRVVLVHRYFDAGIYQRRELYEQFPMECVG